jgi:lysophospholipase L1-like esterase
MITLGCVIVSVYKNDKGNLEQTTESTCSPADENTTQPDESTEDSSNGETTSDTETKDTEETTEEITEETTEETTTEEPFTTEAGADQIFEQSLFIGDSRTDGLHLFSGIEYGTFYANTGLTVEGLYDTAFVTDGKKKKTVMKALKGKEFDRILIALGMNELGYPSVDNYISKYKQMLTDIQAKQPGVPIYIESIIQVTKEKSDSHEYMTKQRIDEFNAALAQLADNETIFYIDVNPQLIDDEGYLKADYSSDGVHLVYGKYAIWLQELIDYFNTNV